MGMRPNPHPNLLPGGEGTCQRGFATASLASSGVIRSGETFKTRSFPLIPLVDGGDAGWGWEVPVFAGTTAGFAGTTHVTNVRAGGVTAQWAVVVARVFLCEQSSHGGDDLGLLSG